MTGTPASAEAKSPVETALSLLGLIAERKDAYHELSRTIMGVQGADFHFQLNAMDGAIEGAVVALLDEILGDTMATYFLYECQHMKDGGFIEFEGKRWPIKTIDDVRRYIEERP